MLAGARADRSAQTLKALRSRVDRLFTSASLAKNSRQEALDFGGSEDDLFVSPVESLSGFIDFIVDAMPHGEVYLFGGVLRDLALYGRRGFDSDVDMVVEGDWNSFIPYLKSIGAKRNKFGGYRLFAGDWPIDIWNAEDTWAIRNGWVSYDGISSLTKTTVLNWDAILMNWRTRAFVCGDMYLDSLRRREIDIVLEHNPNPLGMAVRVFRHLSAKDAKKIGKRAAEYLERCTEAFSFSELLSSELASYKNSFIEPGLYRLFSLSAASSCSSVEERMFDAAEEMRRRGDGITWRQLGLGCAGVEGL